MLSEDDLLKMIADADAGGFVASAGADAKEAEDAEEAASHVTAAPAENAEPTATTAVANDGKAGQQSLF